MYLLVLHFFEPLVFDRNVSPRTKIVESSDNLGENSRIIQSSDILQDYTQEKNESIELREKEVEVPNLDLNKVMRFLLFLIFV